MGGKDKWEKIVSNGETIEKRGGREKRQYQNTICVEKKSGGALIRRSDGQEE